MSSDLQAQVRLDAALKGLGFEVQVRRPEGDLAGAEPSVLVLDLDQLGAAGASRWAEAAGDEVRLLGYFSHIDRELGDRAAELGIETIRRGRFWKQLPELLESL